MKIKMTFTFDIQQKKSFWIKRQKETERKSPLFDGYKQAGQHSIVIF